MYVGNVQMYRAYRHMGGCTGGIKMYGDIEGVYRCMGDCIDV